MAFDSSELLNVLRQFWGHASFHPEQHQVIQAVINNQDSLTVLPTGGGKSLCYQLPVLVRPGLALVVSPLLSLMKDQVDQLQARNISAAAINSTQDASGKDQIWRLAEQGGLKLLYLSPEMLTNDYAVQRLRALNLSYVAVDEAHCVSTWGHDFRRAYRQLSQLRPLFPGLPVHAFTATATRRVREDIVSLLQLKQPLEIIGDFFRPNLHLHAAAKSKRKLLDILSRYREQSGLVYCISRPQTEATATFLKSKGFKADAYHAALPEQERVRVQNSFSRNETQVVVATTAFGMGIDKPDIRFVINHGMPQSLEAFQQQIGRAGRDGQTSGCWLLHSAGDVIAWKKIIETGRGPAQQERSLELLQHMEQYCRSEGCLHRRLVEYFGQPWLRNMCGACSECFNKASLRETSPSRASASSQAGSASSRRKRGIAYNPAEIRKSHPMAYANWTSEQEALLRQLFRAGATIPEMSARLGRQPGGIQSRLQKLGLIEPR